MFCFFVFINFYVNKLVFFYLFEYVKLKEYVCGKKGFDSGEVKVNWCYIYEIKNVM